MESNLEALIVERKTGQEHFLLKNQQMGFDLLGFWQWSGSDLSNNAYRGMLAEYIVACDLGIEKGIRTEWDAFDLITDKGIKVEVKSSAYLQSWHQNKLSKIEFSICPSYGWEANTNTFGIERKRPADVYVFCLLTHQDKATLNPLNLDQWDFYVLATSELNAKIPTQQKISLNSLLKLSPVIAKFGQIKEAISNQI